MKRTIKRITDNEKGFTILELLAVFAILAVIAAIAVPRYSAVVAGSQVEACNANIQMLTKSASMYHEIEGVYPTEQQLVDAGYLDQYVNCPVEKSGVVAAGYQIDATSGTVTCLSESH